MGFIKMRILIFGADGFIGRSICDELEKKHIIFRASRNVSLYSNNLKVDLLKKADILNVLKKSNPETIINCAGVIDQNMDLNMNSIFTKNIIDQAVKVDSVKKIIICGSSGEYGQVDLKNIPVNEDVPLNSNIGYGLSKIKEEKIALKLSKKYKIKVVILRLFNPIGKNMANRFLIPRLLKQINDYKLSNLDNIEISRLDSKRDYIAVEDVASAFRVIIEGEPKYNIYNIGSGRSTTNGEILNLIIKNNNLKIKPFIRETSDEPEVLIANQADISRIFDEFGWKPIKSLKKTIRDICL